MTSQRSPSKPEVLAVGSYARVVRNTMARSYDTGEFEHLAIDEGSLVRIVSNPKRPDSALEVRSCSGPLSSRQFYLLPDALSGDLHGSEMVFFGTGELLNVHVPAGGLWVGDSEVEEHADRPARRAPYPNPEATAYRPKW